MAELIAFPLARRVGLIRKQAALVAGFSREARIRHLDRQVEIQRQALTRKGVNLNSVERECASLAGALHRAVVSNSERPGCAR
jgi:hypothetical protein